MIMATHNAIVLLWGDSLVSVLSPPPLLLREWGIGKGFDAKFGSKGRAFELLLHFDDIYPSLMRQTFPPPQIKTV